MKLHFEGAVGENPEASSQTLKMRRVRGSETGAPDIHLAGFTKREVPQRWASIRHHFVESELTKVARLTHLCYYSSRSSAVDGRGAMHGGCLGLREMRVSILKRVHAQGKSASVHTFGRAPTAPLSNFALVVRPPTLIPRTQWSVVEVAYNAPRPG